MLVSMCAWGCWGGEVDGGRREVGSTRWNEWPHLLRKGQWQERQVLVSVCAREGWVG